MIKIKSHATTTRIEISVEQNDLKVLANIHMYLVFSVAEV